MVDVDTFTEDQKSFLSRIVRDFSGPTATGNLLYVIENLLYTLKPDWELDRFPGDEHLKNDIEVCLAALAYLKIQDVVDG